MLPLLPPHPRSHIQAARCANPSTLVALSMSCAAVLCASNPSNCLLLGICCLMAACRAADTYPNQMLEITVRMYLYRWRHGTEGPVYSQHLLDVSKWLLTRAGPAAPCCPAAVLPASRAALSPGWRCANQPQRPWPLNGTLLCLHAPVLHSARPYTK